jgi:S1-C subfamily serine protease
MRVNQIWRCEMRSDEHQILAALLDDVDKDDAGGPLAEDDIWSVYLIASGQIHDVPEPERSLRLRRLASSPDAVQLLADALTDADQLDALNEGLPPTSAAVDDETSDSTVTVAPKAVGEAPHQFPRSANEPRVEWTPVRARRWMALAAAVLIAFGLALALVQLTSGRRAAVVNGPGDNQGGSDDLKSGNRLPATTRDAAKVRRFGAAHLPLAKLPPKWDMPAKTVTLGGTKDAQKWKLASVIVTPVPGVSEFGSGAIVSADGLILTCYHVIETAVQTAAIKGQTAQVGVILATVEDGRVTQFNAANPAPATVVRVNRSRDLALIKLDKVPDSLKPLSILKVGAEPKELDEVYFVGSQGGGPAWSIRLGAVQNVFKFPHDESGQIVGMASGNKAPVALVDMNARMVSIGASAAPGDSGGPVINEAGQLVGVIDAIPTNETQGAVAWAISAVEVAKIMDAVPHAPEEVPVDIFIAGMANGEVAPETFSVVESAEHISAVGYGVAGVSFNEQRETAELKAVVTYVDLDRRNSKADGKGDAVLPAGLWGREDVGSFKFNVAIAERSDGAVLVGYTDDKQTLAEIRVDSDGDEKSDVVWRRQGDGTWKVDPSAKGIPRSNPRLEKERARFTALRDQVVRSVISAW